MAGGDVNFVERAAAFCGLTTSDTGICVNCHGKFVRKLDPHLKLQYSHLTKMPSPGNELPLTPASHKVTPSNLNCTTTQGSVDLNTPLTQQTMGQWQMPIEGRLTAQAPGEGSSELHIDEASQVPSRADTGKISTRAQVLLVNYRN
jgi:hypothetical protein